ncbi:hypothetical protein ABZ714_11300 [Streptomyces sp. NPDC006798]|uniref:hypothetical protein n=1 Tax=Streptomyces sp. NPDC006798 TaxID=3155462 RepID=UPI003400D088
MRQEEVAVDLGGGVVALCDRLGGGVGVDDGSVPVAQAVEDGLAAPVDDREPQGEVASPADCVRGRMGRIGDLFLLGQ